MTRGRDSANIEKMQPGLESSKDTATLVADGRFFDIFMPREINLFKQKTLEHVKSRESLEPLPGLGLFLMRLFPIQGSQVDPEEMDTAAIARHMNELLRSALRYSDIPGQLGAFEFLAVAREMELENAPLIAQRLINRASRSRVLEGYNIGVRLGFVIYPLSPQPDLLPAEWPTLIELAHALTLAADQDASFSGLGVVPGDLQDSPIIPEIDLISLALTDVSALANAGILDLSKINLKE
ncbi:MAG: hypothetical protein GY906_28590 [bacterium]|nr:hypothetical protein [bacterium]